MSENIIIPHIRIPRSLLENELWINLPLGYREVFYVLLEKVCFLPRKFDDHGIIIDLEPGQICASIREITSWLGKFFDKNIVERSIKKFILCHFVRQEVRHRKTIITITHPDTYNLIKAYSETRSETKLRQSRDKLETQKDNVEKEDNEEKQNKHIVAASFSSDQKVLDFSQEAEKIEKSANIKKSQAKKIDYREKVFLTESEHDELIKKHGQTVSDLLLDKLNNYKFSSGKTYKSDYHAILGWVVDDYNKSFKSTIKNERKTLDAHGNPVKSQYEGMF